MNDIFYFVRESIINYADDTTPYSIKSNYDELIEALEVDSGTLLEWFKINFFKVNADKCKLLISNKDNGFSMDIEGEIIVCEQSVKLLGIKIDNQLTFSQCIRYL